MSADDLTKYEGGVIEMGVNLYEPDFSTRIGLTANTSNMCTGINRGTSPRFGASPIPGQSTLDYTASLSRGLRASELTTGSSLDVFLKRYKFLGVVPISIESYADFDSTISILIWLIADSPDGVNYCLTASPNIRFTDGGASPNTFKYTSLISRGFTNPMWAHATNDAFSAGYTGYLSPIVRRVARGNNGDNTETFLKEVLKLPTDVNYVSSASISVSGGQIPCQWLLGSKTANGSLTATATANMNYLTSGSFYISLGTPSSWNKGNFKRTPRSITFYNLDGLQLLRTYVYDNVNPITGMFLATLNQDYTSASYNFPVSLSPTAIANLRGTAFVAANVDQVLMYDQDCFTDNSYKLVLVAAKGAFGFFAQCWDRDFTGRALQIAPLKDRFHKPLPQQTGLGNSIPGGNYTENGATVSTCFSNFPAYVTGTASFSAYSTASADGYNHFFFGSAGSGVLRANTDYEMTFSIFDKQLGVETNVGPPAKFRTGGADYVAMSLGADYYTGGQYQQISMAGQDSRAPISPDMFLRSDGTSTTYNTLANLMEFRFYYRELGTFEWLPALFVDMAKYFFYPDYRVFWACQGDIAALPGGQPGGFIDYSFLPDEKYDCVVNFKNRAFWFSRNTAIFSLQNNPFAYPLRNATPAPTGGFRGAVVHTYRGQSEQESRLIIFGQRETYIGKFTGVYLQQPVMVSADTTASYDVDGSDFRMEFWTSATAFSYRSAIVADGILYWWGPQGIYRDDGVGVPKKLKALEPDIFNLYDPTLTDEIHCYYDEKTKDITWFYPPRTANTKSSTIKLDVETGEFLFDDFDCKVDWAARVSTINSATDGLSPVTHGLPGLHTIIGSRKTSASTVQRGYFLDQENRAGEFRPETELMGKTLTLSVTANQYNIAFDSGVDATNFATIAVGDYIALTQLGQYTADLIDDTYDSVIGKVTVIDTVAKTMRILLPSGVNIPSVAVADPIHDFPVYHRAASGRGLNAIPYTWETKYWMPARPDVFNFWLFLYLFFKYDAWKKIDPTTFTLSYRTPSGGTYISDTIEFTDNSDGNCQRYIPLRQNETNETSGAGQNQGQAIKIKISGYHIGEAWQLQYLEAHTHIEEGVILKTYQPG